MTPRFTREEVLKLLAECKAAGVKMVLKGIQPPYKSDKLLIEGKKFQLGLPSPTYGIRNGVSILDVVRKQETPQILMSTLFGGLCHGWETSQRLRQSLMTRKPVVLCSPVLS